MNAQNIVNELQSIRGDIARAYALVERKKWRDSEKAMARVKLKLRLEALDRAITHFLNEATQENA